MTIHLLTIALLWYCDEHDAYDHSKVIEHFVPLMLFIVLYKVVLTFESNEYWSIEQFQVKMLETETFFAFRALFFGEIREGAGPSLGSPQQGSFNS